MKKTAVIAAASLLMTAVPAFAQDYNAVISKDMNIQNQISEIGFKLLNSNQIDVRMVFAYNKKDKLIKGEPALTKRQIVLYQDAIKYAGNEDEIAALLAREICKTAESYTGQFKGLIGGAQTILAPKKFEIFFDKRGVDFMVRAGYNPLGMITYINKAFPQKRFDRFGRTNLTSKRLANIYEYIYVKYPVFLAENEYIDNNSYQNFLLNSQDNRRKLAEKIKNNSKEIIKYE